MGILLSGSTWRSFLSQAAVQPCQTNVSTSHTGTDGHPNKHADLERIRALYYCLQRLMGKKLFFSPQPSARMWVHASTHTHTNICTLTVFLKLSCKHVTKQLSFRVRISDVQPTLSELLLLLLLRHIFPEHRFWCFSLLFVQPYNLCCLFCIISIQEVSERTAQWLALLSFLGGVWG